MSKSTLLLSLLLFKALVSFSQERTIQDVLKRFNNNSIPYVYPKDVLLADTVTLLDAREPEEYSVSKIPGAIYVGYDDFDLATVTNLALAKNKRIIVYCSLGVRSEKIANKIKKNGYTNVYNLWGGIFEWKNIGRTVVDSSNRPTENVHAYSKHWGKYLKKGIKVYGRN